MGGAINLHHLAATLVIAIVAGTCMGLAMSRVPAPTTAGIYDSTSRSYVILMAATVVFVVMTCFAVIVLMQQTIRSALSPTETKPKKRRTSKKTQLRQGIAAIVLGFMLGGVCMGLVMFRSPIPGGPGLVLAIVASAVGAGVMILVGGYVLMRQLSRANAMQRAYRRRRRNTPAKSP